MRTHTQTKHGQQSQTTGAAAQRRTGRRTGHILLGTALGSGVCLAVLSPALANGVTGGTTPGTNNGPVISLKNESGPVTVSVDTTDMAGPRSTSATPVSTPAAQDNLATIEVWNTGATTVDVSASRTVGAFNSARGIWGNNNRLGAAAVGTDTQTFTLVNNGQILGFQAGVLVDGYAGACPGPGGTEVLCSAGRMKTVRITGTGNIFGTAFRPADAPAGMANTSWAINVSADTVSIGGLGLIMGDQHGIRATGNILNIGTSPTDGSLTRIGSVIAGTGDGIWADGSTATRMRLSSVTAGGPAGNGVVLASATGTTIINFNGTIWGGAAGVALAAGRTAGSTEISSGALMLRAGTITGGQYGILATGSGSHRITVDSLIAINSSGIGILFTSGIGDLSLRDVGSITSGGAAIKARTRGSLSISSSFFSALNITAGGWAVEIEQADRQGTVSGSSRIDFGNVSAGGGIYATQLETNMTLYFMGGFTSGLAAVYLFDHLGTLTVIAQGSGAKSITSGAQGVFFWGRSGATTGQSVNISDLTSINSTGTAIYIQNGGTVGLSRVGTITSTAGDGIFVAGAGSSTFAMNNTGRTGGINGAVSGIDLTTTGNIDIGIATRNGAVTGGQNGILATGAVIAGIFDRSITGTAQSAVRATATNGTVTLQFESNGTVISGAQTAGTFAVEATATTTATVNVGLGASVVANRGIRVSGTDTADNTAVVSNSGTITAGSGTGTGIAIEAVGDMLVNNAGTINGDIVSATSTRSGAVSISNGGTWNFGTGSSFGGVTDRVTVGGTIRQTHATSATLTGLEELSVAGVGVLDLTLLTSVTQELVLPGRLLVNFGRIKVDFNPDATLGTNDRGTSGNADSITVNSWTPSGGTVIDIVATGGTNGAGAPMALTGSVQIIHIAGQTAPAAPGAGDTLTAAANFSFGTGNPSTSTRTFTLVQSAAGLYLQWVPVITAPTVGSFAGGALGASGEVSGGGGSGGGPLGLLQASLAGASSATARIADMTGFGAAFGGSQAAGAGCGTGGGASFSARSGNWAGSGTRAGSGAVADGGDLAFSPGAGSDSCGRMSVGVFRFGGTASTDDAGAGASRSTGTVRGAGGYLRADSGDGWYAQVAGAAGTGRSQVVNAVFRTTAEVDNTYGLLELTAGRTLPVAEGMALDTRITVSRTSAAADPFKDSLGFEVTRLETRADAMTLTAGMLFQTDSGGQGFVRAGVRTLDARQEGDAYGRRTLSEDSQTSGVLELGWNQPIGEDGLLEFSVASGTGVTGSQNSPAAQAKLVWSVSW